MPLCQILSARRGKGKSDPSQSGAAPSSSFSHWHFSALPAISITSQPDNFATWQTMNPTVPAAPETNTVSSSTIRQLSCPVILIVACLAGLKAGIYDSLADIEAIWRQDRAFTPLMAAEERTQQL